MIKLITLLTLLLATSAYAYSPDEIKFAKHELISISLQGYDGPCPCPDFHMSNGRRCGNLSAYSKPGGARPLCYLHDVSDEKAVEYLDNKNGN